jgi:mRNA-degrading endonuclease RelE of RelBE toxin-antitoxin system
VKLELLEIPGVEASHQTSWKIRALAIDGVSPALEALLAWEKSEKADYKKIMKVMRIVGQSDRVRDEKHVKKSSNADHENVYEMRAHRGHARLMFFYSEEDEAVVVCTTSYWKGKGDQDTAFRQCSRLKQLCRKANLF